MNTEYENKVAAIEATKRSVDLIISGEGLQSAGGLSAGDAFKVPGWQWVSPMLPIENQYRSVLLGNWQTPSSGFLGFGDNCGMQMRWRRLQFLALRKMRPRHWFDIHFQVIPAELLVPLEQYSF